MSILRSVLNRCAVLFLMVVSVVNHSDAQSHSQSVEEAIWGLEEAYQSNHRDAEHWKILATYHESFLGWPDPERRPVSKSDMPDYLRRNFASPVDAEFEIERAGIRVVGDVAINHYIVHVTFDSDNGKERTRSVRITHTWLRENGRWQLIGGMSNE